MLSRLRVRNLAIVEDVCLEFDQGLNVLTGETGAGKSLLVEALTLLLGGRGDPGCVRSGAGAAVIEGEFLLSRPEVIHQVGEVMERSGCDWDGHVLVLRREVSAEGRSRATVNHSPATLAALRSLGEVLVDIHGQHEHQSLLRPGAALLLLDRAAKLEADTASYGARLAAWRAAEDRLAALRAELRTAAEQSDYLANALAEIDRARLREGEEEELRVEADRRRHAARLRELVASACTRLSLDEVAAEARIAGALRSLEEAAALDASLSSELAPLAEARIAVGETSRSLTAYLERLEADPEEIESIEERRALLSALQRKYRRNVGELLAWAEEARGRLSRVQDGEELLEAAAQECAALAGDCVARAARLSATRRGVAEKWSAQVTRELRPLGLPRARIQIRLEVEESPDGFAWRGRQVSLGPSGMDRAELLFAPNAGEPPRPLSRIVSGGELSRFMLALKSVLGEADSVDLLLFDEVDAGIGGAAAQAVGERLRRLSEHRQVLCVTHLPIIASQAARQFQVSKEVREGRTLVSARPLAGGERVEEIARMLAGDLASATTRRQARELLGLEAAYRR